MKECLLLTLGHNSSAIYVRDNEIICGYENERISKIKSDSAFPLLAIQEIQRFYDLSNVSEIYISHWGIIPNQFMDSSRWMNNVHLEMTFPNAKIFSVNSEFTHHDAHAWSVMAFDGLELAEPYKIVVCDGFGNYGETLSIYSGYKEDVKCIHRTFGFDSSLGLFYQYATSYLGLKENQDEYKLLGYEAHVPELFREELVDVADTLTATFIKRILSEDIRPKYDGLVSIDALPALKMSYYEKFDFICKRLKIDASDIYTKRTVISYIVQRVIEQTMSKIIDQFMDQRDNLLLSGGVFMNVKLNNSIARHAKNKVTIMPLCGDQGAAIGLYYYHNRQFKFPDNLFWGERNLNHDTLIANGISVLHDIIDIARLINNGYIVNLVKGNMEFGSRALCNTSSLMLPNKSNVDKINTLNNRSTIMPCAPVMTESTANHVLGFGSHTIHKSLEYMICAVDFVDEQFARPNLGAAHYDIDRQVFTCRPQIVKNDEIILELLGQVSSNMLVNTSYNYHGIPIVYDEGDIIYTHENQLINQNNDIKFRTYII